MATVKITGLDDLRRALRDLPRSVTAHVLGPALHRAIRPMKAAVVAKAPRRKGGIARSVAIRDRATRKPGTAAVDVEVGGGGGRSGNFYAAFPEFGTRRQRAQHYVERAFDETKDRCESDAVRLIGDGTLREWESS